MEPGGLPSGVLVLGCGYHLSAPPADDEDRGGVVTGLGGGPPAGQHDADRLDPCVAHRCAPWVAPRRAAGGAGVAAAVKLLSDKRIGALVVLAEGRKPVGIISERDIVRELGRRGAAVLDLSVAELMTRSPATCTTGEDARAILERMTEGRFRHLPVVDGDGEMIGLVSIGDAVSARLKELRAERDALTGMIIGH